MCEARPTNWLFSQACASPLRATFSTRCKWYTGGPHSPKLFSAPVLSAMPLLDRSVIRRVPHCNWAGGGRRGSGKWGLPGAGFKQGRHYLKCVIDDERGKWLVRGPSAALTLLGCLHAETRLLIADVARCLHAALLRRATIPRRPRPTWPGSTACSATGCSPASPGWTSLWTRTCC